MKKSFHLWSLLAVLLASSGAVEAQLYTLTTNYSVGSGPTAVALANLRGKSLYRDLAVANTGADTVTVRLCLDNGAFGQANSYTVGAGPVSVKNGDFNTDKQDDLVTANAGTNTLSVLMNLGVGANFAVASNYVVGTSMNPQPVDMAVGDFNRDGKVDLVCANFADNSVSLLTNRGNGTFGGLLNIAVGNGPSAIFAMDMNLDGKLDIIVAHKTDGTVAILPGNGDGTFGAIQTITYTSGGNPQPVALVCRDVDHSGTPSILVANRHEGTVTVLIGDSTGGNWSVHRQDDYVAGFNPVSLIVRDLDHDNLVDFGVVNAGDETFKVFVGDGAGNFVDDSTYAVGANPAAAAASNLNSDDAADVVVVDTDDDDVSVLLYSAPIAYDQTVSLNEDSVKSFSLRGTLLGGGSVVFLTNSVPTNGTVTLAGSNIVYTPTADYFGPDSFTYVSVDVGNSLTSKVATVTLAVASVNDLPSFTLTTNYVAILEDSPATNILDFIATTNVGPDNEAGQTVNYVVTTTNRMDFSMTPMVSASGAVTFRPAVNHTGLKALTIVARDSGGTLRGGTNTSVPQTFYVDIIPNPVKPLHGTFSGLYYDTNGFDPSSGGFFTFTLGTLGKFTGRLTSDTGRDSFTGQFDTSGYALVSVPRRSGSPIDLELQLDTTNNTDRVLGTATDGSFTADLQGDRMVFNVHTNPATQAGRYTLVLPGENGISGVPAGDSFAFVNVTAAGNVSANGRLADDTSFSQTVGLSKNGRWPFYASLYNYRGVVMGWIQFTNLPETDLDGDLFWSKTAFATTYYPDGFNYASYALGSTYSYTNGVPVVGITNTALVALAGNLDTSPFVVNGSFSAANTGTFSNGSTIALTVPRSGGVTGNFKHPTLNTFKRINGVALQKQGQLRGYFLGTDESGSIIVTNR